MTIVVMPIMGVVFAIMMPIGYYFFVRYMRASTELRRLLQLSYTPMINNVSELINGLTSVTVYKKNKMMDQTYNKAANECCSSD